MRLLVLLTIFIVGFSCCIAQKVSYLHGKIHVGNGNFIEDGALYIEKGKITYCGPMVGKPQPQVSDSVIDLEGQHIYPGFISVNTFTGLNEIDASRPTRDFSEVGLFNPEIRSQIAFNTDSKILPTLSFNGILSVDPTPGGGILSGTSSLMSVSGNNWEDATLLADHALHLFWPEMNYGTSEKDKEKRDSLILEIKLFFEQTHASYADKSKLNVKSLALEPIFSGKRKIWLHAENPETVKEAFAFLSKWPVQLVLVGGRNCLPIASWMAEKNIPIILGNLHSLPTNMDDDINAPYRLAYHFNSKKVLVGLSSRGSWETRNLPFEAGTAVAWGLKYEDAVACISGNLSKIIGIDNQMGTLELGKWATFFVSKGDALDMQSNNISLICIQGKGVPVGGFQQQQFDKYKRP